MSAKEKPDLLVISVFKKSRRKRSPRLKVLANNATFGFVNEVYEKINQFMKCKCPILAKVNGVYCP